jgi:hypothetical protein
MSPDDIKNHQGLDKTQQNWWDFLADRLDPGAPLFRISGWANQPFEPPRLPRWNPCRPTNQQVYHNLMHLQTVRFNLSSTPAFRIW